MSQLHVRDVIRTNMPLHTGRFSTGAVILPRGHHTIERKLKPNKIQVKIGHLLALRLGGKASNQPPVSIGAANTFLLNSG